MHPITTRFQALQAILLLAGLCTACALGLATPWGEAAIGAKAAEQVEDAVGLVEAPALQEYVDAVGQQLAEGSRVRSMEAYRFRVVDMPEPNAFALPGGYIYVSRGLLVLMNDESELANALAHEVAHVSARHHLRHSLTETPFIPVRLAGGAAALAVRLVMTPLGRLGRPIQPLGNAVALLGRAPGSLLLASHSRSQENQADALGQEIAADAGWDPQGMASLMAALGREVSLRGGDPEQVGFLATHPSPPDRERTTRERAAALTTADRSGPASSREGFLTRLDGLLVGPPARDGVVAESEFLHVELDLRLAFPPGWEVVNGVRNVTATPPEDDAETEGGAEREAFATLSIAAEGDDPLAVAREVVASHDFEMIQDPTAVEIGKLKAARAEGRERGGSDPYRLVAHWIAHRGLVFQLVGAAPAAQWERWSEALEQVATSTRPLEPADHSRIVEARLRIVHSRPGETLAELRERHDSAWELPALAAANALAEDTRFDARSPVKIAIRELYEP